MFTFLALAACGEAVEIEVPQVSSIRVEPAELTITTGPGGGEDAEFIAYGVYPDGREAVLDQVEWTLSNRSVGELEGGLFTASGNGGVSWVLAELAGLEGSATLTVLYEEERVEEGANKEAFLADGRGEASFWLYPEDYVNIPRNTPGITFMWSDIWGGASCYRLQISSEITDLVVSPPPPPGPPTRRPGRRSPPPTPAARWRSTWRRPWGTRCTWRRHGTSPSTAWTGAGRSCTGAPRPRG